ncbi:hypothetical protein LptCag_0349 [Leptospirillum ferriphilum]|uniref:Uncharacterized protein n=1 Tax=Leptospirillum ferriphilum TaxID=178606 RepID=A0A094W749_9BACT|nr:hypothetical protein LptCag_0349 [Leptospirillum ferriphilum]
MFCIPVIRTLGGNRTSIVQGIGRVYHKPVRLLWITAHKGRLDDAASQ